MDSKSCDDVSTVNGDGEWANFSSDPELLYGSRKIPNENARKVNVNDQQSSSDGAENAVMGENEITVLIKILVEEMNGGADFLPEICVEKKFEAVPLAVGEEEEEKQKQPIIVANLLQELPAIIGEYYDAISIEQFVPVVYANSKTFPEMLITMGRREKLENGGKYFVKMFQNTQHRGIGSQLGCSSATLRTSMASFAPSQFNFPTAPNGPNKFQSTPGFGPFNLQQQQQNSVDNQNWQLKLQHAILEIQKKLEKMKKLKHEEMAEHCNFQSKIKELELKLAELVEGQISKETEQQSKFVEIEKMLDELKNAEKPKNDGFHKRMEELKIGFDRAQDHQTKVNFLRSLAPNSQQLEVNVSGAAGEILTDELSWKKLLEAIATTGSECASIRIRDVQLPSAYEFTFAQELLAMASGPENVTMVKHLEFALRGMAGLDPMILARFGEHWPQQNQVILRANALNGFTVEMMMENSKILEFKMVHINCVCKANCSLGMHFTHPWFDLDGYLYAISGGKKRFYLTNLPAPLKNCALLFNICSTKGAMFEFIDLQLENNLECDLLAKLINFWQSKEIKNGIRHIILRDPNKLDATTFDRILSCKQLYKSDTNGCSQFVWQVINSPVVEECYVIKFKSTTSDGTLIECSRMDTTAVAYTITPFDVNGNNILIEDTLTQAWISSWASTTTITISRTCNVDSILTFMQQRPELLPNQFDFQFPTGTGASIAPSAQILALMEEKNIACHHSSNGANFCCGRHCYQSMAGCINASYAYLHCCGYHTKTYPPICIHPTNKANCCKNGHQIYPHSHKHYILGSGNDKFELKIYIANTNNTINCLIGKKCA